MRRSTGGFYTPQYGHVALQWATFLAASDDSDMTVTVTMWSLWPTYTIPSGGAATLRLYRNNDKMIGMMGRMSVKLPMHTQFDGRNPQFKKWSGEVKAY
eukprot:568593-Amphidinium_carterae.2